MIRRIAVLTVLIACVPYAASAQSATLYMSPERGAYPIGEVFQVRVLADTDGEAIQGAEAELSFNPNALMVDSVSTDDSVLSLWPTPPTYSNTEGTVAFSGTASRPYRGDNGVLVTISFRTVSNLPANVTVVSGAILAADARASNIIATMRSALFRSAPARTLALEAAPEPVETDPAPEVAGVRIETPAIVGYDERIVPGGRLVLHGTAAPDSRVYVLVQRDGDAPHESAVLTTSDGAFTYVLAEPVEHGIYEAWAEVRESEHVYGSPHVEMRVATPGLSASAAAVVAIASSALPLLALLIVLGGVLGYVLHRRTIAKTLRT